MADQDTFGALAKQQSPVDLTGIMDAMQAQRGPMAWPVNGGFLNDESIPPRYRWPNAPTGPNPDPMPTHSTPFTTQLAQLFELGKYARPSRDTFTPSTPDQIYRALGPIATKPAMPAQPGYQAPAALIGARD